MLDLAGREDSLETERDSSFWNRSVVIMKSTAEKQWLDLVHAAKRTPNYGMRDLDGVLEERSQNKLEIVGPVVDSFLKHMGTVIYSKLSRSKNTGLMPPFNVFVPWEIFRHIFVLVMGYGGNNKTSQRSIELTIDKHKTAKKVLSPVRMGGNNCLKKRIYKKVLENGRFVSTLNGRAAVIISKKCPMTWKYDRNKQIVCVLFYVQRYDVNDMAIDLALQKLING